MSAAVIAGSFADYRLVKSRGCLQLVIEVPVEQQGAAFAALGYPLPGTEIPVAVARLNPRAGAEPALPRTTLPDKKPSTDGVPPGDDRISRDSGRDLDDGRTVGSIPATGATNSPAGPQPSTERIEAAVKSPGKDTRQIPAGESKDRRPWNELPPQTQAGILCSDGGFQKYVHELTGWIADEQSAAVWLREQLGILSRRDLEGRPDLAAKLNEVRAEFMEWAGRVPVGAR